MPLSLERASGHHRLHPQQGAGLGKRFLLRALLQWAHGARTALLRLELVGGLCAGPRTAIVHQRHRQERKQRCERLSVVQQPQIREPWSGIINEDRHFASNVVLARP
jgi:hypothetical protein